MGEYKMTEALPVSENKPFPIVWKSLVWVAIFFLMQFVMSAITVAIAIATHPEKYKPLMNPDGLPQAQMIALTAIPGLWGLILSGFITLGLLLFHMRKENRIERIGLSFESPRPTVTEIGIAIGLIAITYVFNYLYGTYLVKTEELQTVTIQFLNAIPNTALYLFAKILAVSIFAGVLEEIIFRGFLQNALKRHMSVAAAIILSAVIFGSIHFQPLAFPGLALMGAVFGYIYHRTGSLLTVIGLHAANNAMAIALT
jgi:membrane protease YdiL (CAAX protease family)